MLFKILGLQRGIESVDGILRTLGDGEEQTALQAVREISYERWVKRSAGDEPIDEIHRV